MYISKGGKCAFTHLEKLKTSRILTRKQDMIEALQAKPEEVRELVRCARLFEEA